MHTGSLVLVISTTVINTKSSSSYFNLASVVDYIITTHCHNNNVGIGYVIFSPIIIPLALVGGFVGFTANIIQFGIDQLHDLPGEDRTLFIHWYWWVYYTSISLAWIVWLTTFHIPSDLVTCFR